MRQLIGVCYVTNEQPRKQTWDDRDPRNHPDIFHGTDCRQKCITPQIAGSAFGVVFLDRTARSN